MLECPVEAFMDGLPPVETEAQRLLTKFAAMLSRESVMVEERTMLLIDGRLAPSESEQLGLSDYSRVLARVKADLEAGRRVTECEETLRQVAEAVRRGRA